jgi:hypothetical protein
MAEMTPTIYHEAGVFHAYSPVDGFQRFELKVTHHKDQTVSNLDPLIIYVTGGMEKLSQLLEKWNRGKNFKYEVKP